jgi:RNA polymerase sigma-70 factor, ECF subfamily
LNALGLQKTRELLQVHLVHRRFPSIEVLTKGGEMQQERQPLARQEPEESKLILDAKAGDAEAFHWLYEKHYRRVFALCWRMVGNHALAEELTQDTFLQVFRRLNTFRGDSRFSTWLHRIAVNETLMSLRRRQHIVEEIPLEEPDDENNRPNQLERLEVVDRRLASSNDRVRLEHAISQLPSGYAAIFVLHDVFGYAHHEIAELLGCTVGNTKSQLHKARMRLRSVLRGEPLRHAGGRRAKSTGATATAA